LRKSGKVSAKRRKRTTVAPTYTRAHTAMSHSSSAAKLVLYRITTPVNTKITVFAR
jgi:hypothetical protein